MMGVVLRVDVASSDATVARRAVGRIGAFSFCGPVGGAPVLPGSRFDGELEDETDDDGGGGANEEDDEEDEEGT